MDRNMPPIPATKSYLEKNPQDQQFEKSPPHCHHLPPIADLELLLTRLAYVIVTIPAALHPASPVTALKMVPDQKQSKHP